ncbi:MAG: Ku protein [Acidobacteria bacterium]|nr:Ku protein [Acidobacteriota bacterium]
MAPRAIGSGTISFGLVTIPIKVYSASNPSERVSFNLLHEKCKGRLRQQYICPKDDEIVTRDEMVKGYEFAKGQYVLFSEDELKALEGNSTQAIEISEFVPADTVDPIYFEKAYYLGPDRHGSRPYALLSRALTETGRWALARYSSRGKQYLVALRPLDGGLVMQQLHYSSEVRPFSELDIDTEVTIKPQELELAITLADQVTSEQFDPESYKDEEVARLRDLIQRKVEGEEVSLVEERPQAQVIDLMEALRRSLEGTPAGSKGAKKAGSEKATRKPAKRAPRKAAAAKARKKKS